MHCTVSLCLFRIIIIICVAFFRQGWNPSGTHIRLFVERGTFLQFFPILQPGSLTGTHSVLRGIAHRPSVARSTFRCLVNRTLRQGLALLYPDFNHT